MVVQAKTLAPDPYQGAGEDGGYYGGWNKAYYHGNHQGPASPSSDMVPRGLDRGVDRGGSAGGMGGGGGPGSPGDLVRLDPRYGGGGDPRDHVRNMHPGGNSGRLQDRGGMDHRGGGDGHQSSGGGGHLDTDSGLRQPWETAAEALRRQEESRQRSDMMGEPPGSSAGSSSGTDHRGNHMSSGMDTTSQQQQHMDQSISHNGVDPSGAYKDSGGLMGGRGGGDQRSRDHSPLTSQPPLFYQNPGAGGDPRDHVHSSFISSLNRSMSQPGGGHHGLFPGSPPPGGMGPRDPMTPGGLGPPQVSLGGPLTNSNVSSTTSPLVVPQPPGMRSPARTIKTYHCRMCDQIFDNKSDLLVHSQQVHRADPKPYRCPQCQRCFANSSYLSQHARIHAGIKPYKCQICERRFTQLCHLQQHIRTHTGEKPYKCQHPGCGKAFSQLSNLQSHSRSHMTDKPYRCNSCYKCYADEQSLREHIPKHSETKHLKTHICRICGKSYTQETYLARHMTKHQGVDVSAAAQAAMANTLSSRGPGSVGGGEAGGGRLLSMSSSGGESGGLGSPDIKPMDGGGGGLMGQVSSMSSPLSPPVVVDSRPNSAFLPLPGATSHHHYASLGNLGGSPPSVSVPSSFPFSPAGGVSGPQGGGPRLPPNTSLNSGGVSLSGSMPGSGGRLSPLSSSPAAHRYSFPFDPLYPANLGGGGGGGGIKTSNADQRLMSSMASSMAGLSPGGGGGSGGGIPGGGGGGMGGDPTSHGSMSMASTLLSLHQGIKNFNSLSSSASSSFPKSEPSTPTHKDFS